MEMPVPYSFIPKYRKKVLYGRIRTDVREIINTLYNIDYQSMC